MRPLSLLLSVRRSPFELNPRSNRPRSILDLTEHVQQCIDEWLDRARLPCCPLCKTDLRASRTDAGNGSGNGNAASGSGDSGAGAASGAAGADVLLTGDNAV